MPGTIRRIIDRIKEVRSGGNSVVALTVETRLVLQGFDPERFGYDTPDDAARLARIRDIAAELGIDIDDLLSEADVAPDPEATPGPMPSPPVRSSAAAAAAQASSDSLAAAGAASTAAIRAGATELSAVDSARAQSAPGSAGLADAGPEEVAAAAARPGLEGLAEDDATTAAPTSARPGVQGLADPEPAAEPDLGIDDDHPLHEFRALADDVLNGLGEGAGAGTRSGATFAQLMKASLLMGLYSVTNDRALCDHIRHNTLYRWFLGLGTGEGHFDAEAFRQDREAALATPSGRAFFDRLVPKAGGRGLFRSERLQVNGRLIKSWMTQT